MTLLRHLWPRADELPVYVHSNLLHGRSLEAGKLYHTKDLELGGPKWDELEILTIEVELRSCRALILWSGWLYGGPMWSPSICGDVDRNLVCIMDIYSMCDGCEFGLGRDRDGMNACLDAVRNLLLDESHVPRNLLGVLYCDFRSNSTAVKMLTELLVYGSCASDGRTQRWLQEAEGGRAGFTEALHSIGLEFTKKLMGEESPDVTARCAYHVHPPGEGCGVPKEDSSQGEYILQRLLLDYY
jgi:hypothetical protein